MTTIFTQRRQSKKSIVSLPRAYEADFIVEGLIVIEVKALQAIAPVHLRRVRIYLILTVSAARRAAFFRCYHVSKLPVEQHVVTDLQAAANQQRCR